MSNLLLKLLDQWIDTIALPPESRGRFSAPAGRVAPALVEYETPVVDTSIVSPESLPDAAEASGLPVESRPLAADRSGASAEALPPVAESLSAPDVLTSRMDSETLQPTLQPAPQSVSDALHEPVQPPSDAQCQQTPPVPDADSTDDVLSAFNWD